MILLSFLPGCNTPVSGIAFTATGNSMEPVIYAGDTIIIDKALEPMLNDIVVFSKYSRFYVHRVIKLNPIVTKGDNSSTDDGPQNNIIGVVVEVVRQGRLVYVRVY